MTDKEKKSKIADILLEFYEEYQYNMPNRPMIPSLYASKIIDSMQEEPVSEELEEAADNALSNVLNTHEIVNVKSCLEMFRLGAKWQKEQMMAKAIDAKLLESHLIRQKGVTHPLHVGDKVKVIVIKED